MKGIFGEIYTEEISHFKVVKKDGKTFYIPKDDIKKMARLMEINERLITLQEEHKNIRI